MSNQINNTNDASESTDPTELSLDELMLVQGGSIFGKALDWTKEAVSDAADWVEEAAEDTVDAVVDAAEWTWDAVNSDTFGDIVKVVGGALTLIAGGQKAYDYFHPDPQTEEALQSFDRSKFEA